MSRHRKVFGAWSWTTWLPKTRATFATWLQSTRAVGLANSTLANSTLTNGTLAIQVRNQAALEWLERRLDRKVQNTVDYFSAAPLEIRFVTDQKPQERDP